MKTKLPRESVVLRSIVAELQKLRAKGHAIWWTKLHGGPMQTAGLPDLHICLNGQACYLEVKRPGGRATPLQVATLAKIEFAGGTVAVVSSAAEALEALVGALQK